MADRRQCRSAKFFEKEDSQMLTKDEVMITTAPAQIIPAAARTASPRGAKAIRALLEPKGAQS
jgi:hypothetical protein